VRQTEPTLELVLVQSPAHRFLEARGFLEPGANGPRMSQKPGPISVACLALCGLAYAVDRRPPPESLSESPLAASDSPDARSRPDPEAPEGFRLRMPFPAGVVVLCAQGNGSAPGRTHSLPQNLHALDFSNRAMSVVPIVAAAAGTVVYVRTGHPEVARRHFERAATLRRPEVTRFAAKERARARLR
jgi:hypothetical protein